MLLGARIGSFGGAKEPTARDYVQSGLVAMWDGIENAGYGVHDETATAWTNLISGDVTANGATFTSDGLEMTTSSSVLTFTSNDIGEQFVDADNGCTIDFVVTDKSVMTSTIARSFFGSNNTNLLGFKFQRTTNGGGTGRALVGWKGTSNLLISEYFSNLGNDPYKYNVSVVYDQPTLNTVLWVNGIKYTDTTASSYAWTRYVMSSLRFFAQDYIAHGIRLYNRKLTPDEIATNYAIDKARFGLE